MINVLIIGWYGTETIGDRAILAGLLNSMNCHVNANIKVTIGSLYPYISQRTVFEDRELYKALSPNVIEFEIIDSKNHSMLRAAIRNSDLVMMGGGPLMDLQELWMVNYAFCYAKRIGRPTAIAGCGVGPIRQPALKKCLAKIFSKSDLTILRDKTSADAASNIYYSHYTEPKKFNAAIDPAVTCAMAYKAIAPAESPNHALIASVRQFPAEYLLPGCSLDQINTNLKDAFASVVNSTSFTKVHFVPMSYHHLGVDDRYYMKSLMDIFPNVNCSIQKEPLTLMETMQIFLTSELALGMRFHSVVLQTLLSQNQLILDYTGGIGGKIRNFILDVSPEGELLESVIDIQNDAKLKDAATKPVSFTPSMDTLLEKIDIYQNISSILR